MTQRDDRPGTADRRAAARAAAVVLLGVLAPMLAVLASGHTLSWRDTAQLFEPMRPLVSGALREGRLPLWNPFEAAGMPLHAQTMHGVLHPWSLLAALVRPANGIDLVIVLHVLSGALGAATLARMLGASRTGSVAAGFAYGLSGYVLGLSANVQYLAGAGTAPWAIAGLCAAAAGRPSRLALGALGVALAFFAGDPQWALVAGALGLVLAWNERGLRGAAAALAACVAGALLAAVQLMPSAAMLAETNRGAGLSAADRAQWALSPARLFEFVVPGFFAGRPGPTPAPVYLWFDGPSQYPLPYLSSIVIGLPALLLAVFGLGQGRRGRVLGIAALGALWLALGHRSGATQALGWVPVWGSFRYAEKLVGPFTLLVALLAGLGLERAAQRVRSLLLPLAFGGALCALAAALAYVLSSRAPASWPPDVWSLATVRLAAGLGLAAAALCALAAAARWARERTAAAVLVAILWAAALAASPASLHAGRTDSRDPRPLVSLAQPGTVARLVQPVDAIALPVDRGFDMFDAAQAVRSRIAAAPYNVGSGLDAFVTYSGLLPARYDALLRGLDGLGPARWEAFRRFSVSHAVLTPPQNERDRAEAERAVAGGRPVFEDRAWGIAVWAVPHAPWARFATAVTPVRTPDAALAATLQNARTGDASVVLEAEAPAALSPGRVLEVERRDDRVRIVAESDGAGLLVVNDAWWPGWQARLDDRDVAILRADGMMRAVAWPAGRHVLEMRYAPREARYGSIVSLVAALALGAAAAWDLRRRSGR